MGDILRAAAANWKLQKLSTTADFFEHLEYFLLQARDNSVRLLVLPEYFSIELVTLADPELSDSEYPSYLSSYYEQIEEYLVRRSSELGLYIVGGSHFRPAGDAIRNSSIICRIEEPALIKDKHKLIPFEKSEWRLQSGEFMMVPIDNPPIGVQICYEVEFPGLTQKLARNGARTLCVPSFTETVRGFNRVRWCCHARTIEQQVFVLHSSLVGSLPDYELIGYGTAAVLCPCDSLISDNGVLASTNLNEEGLAIANLDFNLLAKIRESGEVLNWQDEA